MMEPTILEPTFAGSVAYVSIMWALFVIVMLLLIRVNVALDRMQHQIRTMLALLGIWADDWADPGTRAKLLVILRKDRTAQPRHEPRETSVGMDLGIGSIVTWLRR